MWTSLQFTFDDLALGVGKPTFRTMAGLRHLGPLGNGMEAKCTLSWHTVKTVRAGGSAVAEALFGLTNPGGRLPVTFYRSASDLPTFDDYGMKNRTYRYFTGQPLYSFGFGLSYTTFTYRNLQIAPISVKAGDPVSVQAEVENTGQYPGDEVVQLYLKDVAASLPVPLLQLQGFTRIHLAPGEKQIVKFTLTGSQMSFADENGNWVLEPGEFRVWVGGQQPDLKSGSQPANVLAGQFYVQA